MKPLAALLALLCLQGAFAGPDPWAARPGPLRIAGPPEMAGVLRKWIHGFGQEHPGIPVQVQLAGTDVGLGALATGRADIAFAGRAGAPQELKAFEWIFRYPPTAVAVMTGSLDHPGYANALVVLVHRDNPLPAVTFAQLRRLFDPHPLGSGLRTWEEAGLPAPWSGHAIHFYLPDTESGTGVFFRDRVLDGARALPWRQVREIPDSADRGAGRNDAGDRIARAVATDRLALAIAPLPRRLPASVKVLAVAAGQDGTPLAPSAAALVEGRYPLGRTVRAYVNAAPAHPADPARAHPLDRGVAAFLRYALGPDGQRDVDAAGGYLRLDPREALAQSLRLDAASQLTDRPARSP